MSALTHLRLTLGILVTLCLTSLPAQADTYTTSNGQTTYIGGLSSVGCGVGGLCYILPNVAPAGCAWSLVYVDMTTAAGKNIYSTILTTKAVNKTATIVYSQSTTGVTKGLCAASYVFMGN